MLFADASGALATAAASAANGASTGAATVTASVQPDSATVGDRLTLTLSVVRDRDAVVVFPDVESAVAPFEVLGSIVSPAAEENGRVTERRDYVIAAFKTGDLGVPRLPFLVVAAPGNTLTAFTDSIPVTIASVLPDTAAGGSAEPRDIRPPVDLPREIWPFVVAAAAVAGGVLAYKYLRRWWLRRKAAPRKPAEEPAVPPEAAHAAAFERLAALEREDLISRGEFAKFYDALSDILRLYLGDRYAVPAIDMTTTELAPALAEAKISAADVEWTTRFLEHADLAKFAKYVPSGERALGDLAAARDFVERTRFRGEAAAPAAATDDIERGADHGEGEAC
jgi:hypothetical protein